MTGGKNEGTNEGKQRKDKKTSSRGKTGSEKMNRDKVQECLTIKKDVGIKN